MGTASLQDRRLWIGGGALIAVILAAASWLLFIHPELSSASDLRSQRDDIVSQNDLAQGQNLRLEEQSHNLDSLKAKLTTALDALPPDSGLPAFTEELGKLAAATSVNLSSINVGAVTPANSPGGTAAPAPAATSTTGSTSSTTGGTGQYSITVTVQSTGTLVHQLTFLKAIESGPRRALVTSSQITESGGSRVASVDSSASMTTQLTVFSAPMSTTEIKQLQSLFQTGS